MATGLQTTNFDFQNFYVGHLTADITNASTDIFIDTIPTPTESCLVIDPDTPANTEVIFYNSKTATKVTTPANGRGYDGSTAVAHLTGTKVILAPVGDMFRYIRTLATTTPQGWTPLASAPNTVTANGNRSYTCVFNGVDYTSTLSPGMRLKTTRTVAAPTQSTSLNGTNQYWSKTAPAGMTFTNNFADSKWIKLTSYGASDVIIDGRTDGTSGWWFGLNSSGQVVLNGFSGGTGNFSRVVSYQSVPLNKWVHIAAQLDMLTFTASTTTSYVMIDGVDVPASVTRGGTNPTALVQAGSYYIGAFNGVSNFFSGKIAQSAIYSAKVTQATILASMHQSLAGTETSLISAYSFNGNANDLNANANNLTANNAAAATNADSPFGGQADGTISSTLDYGIVTKAVFSTNTTLTVQVPEGCAIPTTGGVSAVAYSTQKAPYGMPVQRGKWTVESFARAALGNVGTTTNTWFFSNFQLSSLPIGEWVISHQSTTQVSLSAGVTFVDSIVTLSTTSAAESDNELTGYSFAHGAATTQSYSNFLKSKSVSNAAATTYYLNIKSNNASITSLSLEGGQQIAVIRAENAHL